jgi:hypothetical protein
MMLVLPSGAGTLSSAARSAASAHRSAWNALPRSVCAQAPRIATAGYRRMASGLSKWHNHDSSVAILPER